MTYYLSLHIFCLFTSAIDFNVVNPSNNTLNRKKIIITIFVNETKCIFEKNYKKNHSNNDSKKLLQTPLQKKTPDIMTSVYHNAMSIWGGGGGGGDVPNSSSKIDYRNESKFASHKSLLVHRCITHLWIYTPMVCQTRMANENRTYESLWYCCNI